MVKKLNIHIKPDPTKVLLRFHGLNKKRTLRITENIIGKSEEEVQKNLDSVMSEFGGRHRNFEKRLLESYAVVEKILSLNSNISANKKLLIGANFGMEYTTEAAALFNPSIVRHPLQDNENKLKFVLSLRSTGEGHISSISFREGYITDNGEIELISANHFVTPGIKEFPEKRIIDDSEIPSNYNITFIDETELSERILFPYSSAEKMGMEDVRFVEFIDGNKSTYYGTYTAYSGRSIKSHIIQTSDFKNFEIRELKGEASVDKGLALFPRKINNEYWMISRQDGESLFIIKSNDIYSWNSPKLLKFPELDWEITQIGNCGSPIELDEGWLLLTHGVGFMRKYVISAILLDKTNPEKIVGILDEPLIEATGEERNGYVPNVVYSCGPIKHGENLIIPYAVSDTSSAFARVNINNLLNKLK